MSLFRRDVTLCSLSSGSAGNCTYIGDGYAGVVIDCGISTKQVKARMEAMGLKDAPIDAVFFTHEHSDHVAGAGVFSRALAKAGNLATSYLTQGTYERIDARCRPERAEMIAPGEPVRVRHLQVLPLPVPHDAGDPVAYKVTLGDVSVAVITDLGRSTALIARELRTCDAAVLEFNHDEDMLMEGPYPFPLKQRIRGSHGHLSNRQAAELLADGLGGRLKHLLLAHLSEENNTPGKALAAAADTLRQLGAQDQVKLHLTRQREAIAPIRVEAREG